MKHLTRLIDLHAKAFKLDYDLMATTEEAYLERYRLMQALRRLRELTKRNP